MNRHSKPRKLAHRQSQTTMRWTRSLLCCTVLLGTGYFGLQPAIAASPTPGTVITNQATGSFIDADTNTETTTESNIVQVTVAEVAGITITAQNIPVAVPGATANFDFLVTNVGNDPTKLFLPSAPSSITGGTAGTLQVVGYIPAGGTQVTLGTPINIAAATNTGSLSDPTLGGNTTLGSIPAGAAIIVRVPVTVTAAVGASVAVTLGNTGGQPNASNTPYVLGANGTGANDLYTFDNADTAVTGEASGSPINGDATGHRQEASATQTVSAVAPSPADLTLTKTHNGTFTVGSPATYTFTVNNTGTTATSGTITVTDTLPTGLTKGVTAAGYNTGNFSGTNGTTWKCSIDPTGKIVTCTSTSVIPAGSSASFDLTGIQVDSAAPNPVINTATVSGGGQTNTANDTATDSATVQTTTASCSLQSQLTNTLNLSFSAPPTLISGTASTAGAVYRYSNVATGIDALVTIEIYQGTNIAAATIPQNLGASIRANPDATYQYKVVLVKSTTSIPISPRDFVVTGFDVDGTPGNTVTDFVGFVNPDGYFVNSSTLMQTNLTATGVEFTSTDPGFDDPNLGLPTYAGGAFFLKTNTFTVRGGLRNASAPATRGTSFGVQASKLSSFPSLNCQTFPRTSVVIYGNVFKDTNGNKVQDGAETAYTTAGINAVLVDSNNKVIATTPIAADGSYTFDNIPSNANYTVLITTNTATVGAAPPAILLPNGWITSGENLSGAIDNTVDSKLSFTVNTANIVGANFGIQQPTVPVGKPNLLLVKRITTINGKTTSINGDDLSGYIDDPNNPYDDNTITIPNQPTLTDPPKDTDKWPTPSSYLLGGINGGFTRQEDAVEYTIYFLSTGNDTSKKVLFCDRVPEHLKFVPAAFNGFSTKAPGGLSPNIDRGIQWLYNGNIESLTNIKDGDAAQYFPPGSKPTDVYPTVNCGGANTNGAIVVNLGDLPNATAPGVPASSYGFVRFRAEVK